MPVSHAMIVAEVARGGLGMARGVNVGSSLLARRSRLVRRSAASAGGYSLAAVPGLDRRARLAERCASSGANDAERLAACQTTRAPRRSADAAAGDRNVLLVRRSRCCWSATSSVTPPLP